MALTQTFNQDQLGNIGTAGAVTTASPSYTTGTTSPLSLTLTGLLRIDGSNVTQPISATSLPLPTGASTSALQVTGNTSLASIDGKTPALGQALAAASVPVVLTASQLTTLTPLSTVTVIQPTGTNLHVVVDASALPTGASTAALQTSGNATLSAISAQLPATLGQKVSASSLAVVIASDQSPISVSPVASATSTLTSVAASATTVSLLASNTARKGAVITNDSTAILYLALSSSSSLTAFSFKLFPNSAFVLDTLYTGAISGIWSAASGSARITELT